MLHHRTFIHIDCIRQSTLLYRSNLYLPLHRYEGSEMSSTNRLSQRAGLAAGQPISELMSQALANPNLISLAAGFVDQQSLPIDPTQQALSAVLANPDAAQAALQYGTTTGYPKLREAILNDFLNSEGRTAEEMGLSIDQVVITAGSNQLLHLVGEILLDPGDIVICASPTYFVFFRNALHLPLSVD